MAAMEDDSISEDDSLTASVAAVAGLKAKQPQIRLNAAGKTLLKDFFGTVSDHPTVAHKEELLVKILASGNKHYDIDKLSRWFIRTRSRRSDGIKRPVLTRPAVQTLKLLLLERPHPTDDQMRAWASIAGAQVELVRSWVDKKSKQRPQAAPENPIGPPCNSLPLPSPTPVLQDSINLPALNNLAHLFSQTPYPTDDTLKVWAHHLGLTFEIIRDWVHAQRTPPDSQQLFYDYQVQVEDRGTAQYRTHTNRPFVTNTDVSAINEPFPLPPAFVPPKALPPRLILKSKPVEQNRRLLFDIAERMDLDDPPTTYANAAESGSCDQSLLQLQIQESSSALKTMSREQFLSSYGFLETKMRHFMDQLGKGVLQTEGWGQGHLYRCFLLLPTLTRSLTALVPERY